MKRLLISVAILLFVTMLFVQDENNNTDESLVKDDVVLNSNGETSRL